VINIERQATFAPPCAPVFIHFMYRVPLGKPRHTWEDNIERDLKGIEWESMGWTESALRRGTWRAVVNTVMNLRVPYSAGNFLTS